MRMAKPKKTILDTFGRSLGWTAKKWVEGFDNEWRYKLARAIIRGETEVRATKKDGTTLTIRVPKAGDRFRSEAKDFLKAFREIKTEFHGKMTRHPFSPTRADIEFNNRVLYGTKKIFDRGDAFRLKNIYESAIINAEDPKLRRKLKKEYENFKSTGRRYLHELTTDA